MVSYALATPLIFASPFMYCIFSESMFSGEVCKFYDLAGNESDDPSVGDM